MAYQDVVLFAGAEKMVRHAGGNDTMTALSAATGEVLWTAPHPPSGYDSPEDLLIVDGLVWTAPMTNRRDSGQFTGRDVHTGQVKRTFESDNGDVMPHHRCHRARATDRFILASRTGIEYVDLAAQHWNRNDWVRGACLYGIMPANGLSYAPPQSCACYILAKLTGLNALAAESPSRRSPAEARPPGGEGLERGPAYDAAAPAAAPASGAGGDWPAFRHDAARSGFTTVSVPAELKCGWQADLGGVLSSPVVAEGKVFVASIDAHVVYALDERTGRPVWQYAAGGRVDSPPTVWQGRVLFGSADGYVYCLRAADGALAWRFRAAPADLRLVAWEQVESVWPVHGAVLVRDGLVHCVAGRSMFLDGGMRYLRIDVATGRLVSETLLDNRNPETGDPLDAHVKWPNLPVALPDALSCDGKYIYMRSQRFDLGGVRTDVAAPANARDQAGDGAHLFATTGFLDGSWWHRTFWVYGKTAPGGAGGWYTPAFFAPTGRIMVCDERRVYAFERLPQYYPRTPALEYHLFAAAKEPKIVAGGGGAESKTKANRAAPSHPAFDWSRQVPLLGRSMTLAGTTLFVAGPPDLADEEEALTRLDAAETQQALAAQAEAFEGKRGALLMAVAASDGKTLAAWRLPAMPVFDGMAAANGGLVLCASDGKVFRLGAEGQPLTPATDAVVKAPAPAVGSGDGAATADFQQLSQVRVTAAGLGWRVQSNPGKVGFALRQLETPLTKQATFRLRLHMIPRDASADPPRNGFFVFGEAPDDEHLVKCGLRRASALIVHGPFLGGRAASAEVEAKIDAVVDLVVTVDLAAHKATMTACGRTVEAALPADLKYIKYIGYCTHSLASEFSRVEIGGQ